MLLVLLAVCLPPSDARGQLDVQYIPESAIGAVVLYPKAAAALESLDLLPHEIVSAAGQQQFGVDPLKIEQAVLLLDKPSMEGPPEWGCIIRFDEATIPGGEFFRREVTPVDFRGQAAWGHGEELLVVDLDHKTFLLGSPAMVAKMVDARGVESGLTKMLQASAAPNSLVVCLDFEPVRGQMLEMLAQVPDVPPPFQPFLKLPELVQSITLQQQLDEAFSSRLTMLATGGNGAKLAATIGDGLRKGKDMLLALMSAQMNTDDPVQNATIRYFYRLGDYIERQMQPAIDGDSVVFEGNGGIAAAPLAVALLLPAVQQTRAAARRVQSANNLRQLILAMHNFHDAYKRFPTNLYDDNGNVLLSWRVQILPFVEENNLYQQFHLDEPWDSEHNLNLVDQMPEILACPDIALEPGKTLYLGVAGHDTVFDADARGIRLSAITDGTSNTIALVEASPERAVIWTRPDDLNVDWNNPMNGLGGIRPGGFNVAMCDGSVRFISESLDPQTLAWLFQRNDGNVVDPDALDR
jgi:prepilin-type processing-associated H-X9-DG protein